MADVLTRADALRVYLTGAASDGGAQTDPNAALGNFRSSTEATTYGISISSPITNITIDFAGGYNAVGAGSLECTGVSALRWKDAGGTFGAPVTILNGETKVIEAAGFPGAYVRVTRTSAINLVLGTATVTLARTANNVWGFDNVSSAEAAAGDIEYRGVMLKNVGTPSISIVRAFVAELATSRVSGVSQLGASGSGIIATASSLADWPDVGWCHVRTNLGVTREIVYYTKSGSTLIVDAAGRARLGTSAAAGAATDTIHCVPGIAIGKDTAGVTSAAAIQTIANEGTAPTSVTFSADISAQTGVVVGTMATLQQCGLWLKREIPVGAVSISEAIQEYGINFDGV